MMVYYGILQYVQVLKPHVFEGIFVVPLYPQLLLLKLCLSRLHLQLNLRYNKCQDSMKIFPCSRAFPAPVIDRLLELGKVRERGQCRQAHSWALSTVRREEPGTFYEVCHIKGRHNLIMQGWTKSSIRVHSSVVAYLPGLQQLSADVQFPRTLRERT